MICECISLLRGKDGNTFGHEQGLNESSCGQMGELADQRRVIIVARLGAWIDSL